MEVVFVNRDKMQVLRKGTKIFQKRNLLIEFTVTFVNKLECFKKTVVYTLDCIWVWPRKIIYIWIVQTETVSSSAVYCRYKKTFLRKEI